jgi:hypothetical protein
MPLWTFDPDDDGGRWVAAPLPSDEIHLATGDGAAIHRSSGSEGERWVLIGSATVSVNALPLLVGLHVLRDRDEIRLGEMRVFFSTETLAAVAACPAAPEPLKCPRCTQTIDTGAPAVRCPQCGVWHHQSERLPCWTYVDTCQLCDQTTALDGTYRWTPEDL